MFSLHSQRCYSLTRAGAQSKATLEVSETIFSVLSAINVCGYDHELSVSSPIRTQVRVDLVAASKSPEVAAAAQSMCKFYHDHRSSDSGRQLAEYVSLALNLGDPPNFVPKFQEADLPPDASYVLGFVPLLKQYAAKAKLHAIWLDHEAQYNALVNQFHDPVASMITATDGYLRMPSSGYLGRSYTMYLDPMAAPGEVNSRNYQADYFYVVVSPANNDIHMNQLRHTYLHFVLEPLLSKRATTLARLKPILTSVQKAPMAPEYKTDIGLLVIESLIRAIEARTPIDPKLPEKERMAMVNRDEAEGFVLTGYFYDQLKAFEKGSRDQGCIPRLVARYRRRQGEEAGRRDTVCIGGQSDVVQASQQKSESKIEQAERALASGNPDGAVQLAQEALAQNEDPGRCYFVLARAATLSANMDEAKDDLMKAAAASKDPQTVAWSHIYLGRILDCRMNVMPPSNSTKRRSVLQTFRRTRARRQNEDYRRPTNHPRRRDSPNRN